MGPAAIFRGETFRQHSGSTPAHGRQDLNLQGCSRAPAAIMARAIGSLRHQPVQTGAEPVQTGAGTRPSGTRFVITRAPQEEILPSQPAKTHELTVSGAQAPRRQQKDFCGPKLVEKEFPAVPLFKQNTGHFSSLFQQKFIVSPTA